MSENPSWAFRALLGSMGGVAFVDQMADDAGKYDGSENQQTDG
jgi:hypothetical protein